MNQPIRCLIIDDEPIARRIIANYCSHLPFLQIVAECDHALAAKAFLNEEKIDLIFLDIHMPVMSGVGFLSTLPKKPWVIFTTAYQEYAVNAFELSAVDYLVKPFSLERFVIAVEKVQEKLQMRAHTVVYEKQPVDKSLIVKAENKLHQVMLNDCLYAEAQANYTKLVTTKNVLLTKMSFTDFIEQLPAAQFIRVHRSFVVNKNAIAYVEGNYISIEGWEVPIAATYKTFLLSALGKK